MDDISLDSDIDDENNVCRNRDETTMKIRPLHDRVIVRREEEEQTTAGGIS